jgi:hypothetical protein
MSKTVSEYLTLASNERPFALWANAAAVFAAVGVIDVY